MSEMFSGADAVRQRADALLPQADRSGPHFARKFYHALMGLICYTLYAFVLTQKQSVVVLASIGGFFVLLDVVRLRWRPLNVFLLRRFGALMRREEYERLTANSWYVFGMLTLAIFFPKPYAELGLLFLAFGDPAAAMVGVRFGRTPITPGKTLEGALANFLVCALLTFISALWRFQWPADEALLLAVCGGLGAAVAEAIPWPVDDNFSLPVVSALLLAVFCSAFSLPLAAALR